MKYLLPFFALFVGVLLLPAQTHQLEVEDSGNAFLSLCDKVFDKTADSAYQQAECFAYTLGVEHGMSIAYEIQEKPLPYCLPAEATKGQIYNVIIKYLKDHPEKTHLQTRVLIPVALSYAFPCAEKK